MSGTDLVRWEPETREQWDWYLLWVKEQDKGRFYYPPLNDVRVDFTKNINTPHVTTFTRWYLTLDAALRAAPSYMPPHSSAKIRTPWELYVLVRAT